MSKYFIVFFTFHPSFGPPRPPSSLRHIKNRISIIQNFYCIKYLHFNQRREKVENKERRDEKQRCRSEMDKLCKKIFSSSNKEEKLYPSSIFSPLPCLEDLSRAVRKSKHNSNKLIHICARFMLLHDEWWKKRSRRPPLGSKLIELVPIET